MATVEARYLGGVSTTLNNIETVGDVMFDIATSHGRSACSVAVVCPDTGKNLSDEPSETPPPLVQVVIKPEEKEPFAKDDLLLVLRIHAEHDDDEVCVRAHQMLQKSYRGIDTQMSLEKMLVDAADGDTPRDDKLHHTLVRTGIDGAFALERASLLGREKRVKALIAAGVLVDSENANCFTALMSAASAGRASMVETLLSHGANVNRGHRLGVTALAVAFTLGRGDVRVKLQSHLANANANFANEGRWTALRYAMVYGHAGVEEMLRSHGAIDPRDDDIQG